MKSSRLTLLAAGLAAAAFSAEAQLPSPAPATFVAQANPSALSPSEMEKAGVMSAQAWLQLLDRRDWGTAWDISSGMFRTNVPLATWMENVPQLRSPFGNFVERQVAESAYKRSLQGQPAGDYVTVVFTSKFDKRPDVREFVTTVREPDGRWRVTGYTAR
jgi:hypothetical protein